MEALLEHCASNDTGGAGEDDFHCGDFVRDGLWISLLIDCLGTKRYIQK